jgi:hypothetical protein
MASSGRTVARTITGTAGNGHRFFGLRHHRQKSRPRELKLALKSDCFDGCFDLLQRLFCKAFCLPIVFGHVRNPGRILANVGRRKAAAQLFGVVAGSSHPCEAIIKLGWRALRRFIRL